MNPQDDGFAAIHASKKHADSVESGIGEASERDPLVSSTSSTCVAWGERERRLLGGQVLTVLSTVAGTYYYISLLPAWEHDSTLAWTARTSTRLNTIAQASETIGLFFAGPLADHFFSRSLLGLEATVACLGMLFVSFAATSTIMCAVICGVMLFKGLMWPTIGNMIAANMSASQHDASFLVVSFSSRVGDTFYSALFGVMMGTFGFGWRSAAHVLLATLVPMYMLSFFVVFPEEIAEPGDAELSVGGWCYKWKRMLADVDGWLAFLTLAGTYTCWALSTYVTVLCVDMYGASPGDAAGAGAYLMAGMCFGLLVGSFIASVGGVQWGRAGHVVQGLIGVAALHTLATWRKATFQQALILQSVVGFGFVVPAYLPYLAYAAASPPAERAFRLASLDGAGSLWCIALTYAYGTIRQRDPGPKAAEKIYTYTAIGLGISIVAMGTLYWRLGRRRHEHDRT